MQKRKPIIISIVLVLVAAALAGVWYFTQQTPVQGGKAITVQMIYDDTDRSVTISTDADYLRGAMEQEGLISGTESDYGLWVTTVDGRMADDSKQEWWCLTQDGAMTETGVDTTVINDGDKFEFTLTTGW